MPLFKDITRLGTIPVADPTQAPHATPHSEMVEFTVADYIHRDKLKALLDKLFPGNWKARVRGHLSLGFAHSVDN